MSDFEILKQKVTKELPDSAGVYCMRGSKGDILYIGKAGNLRRRVSSYFLRAHDARIERLMQEVREIGYEITETALEALILEAKRIKEHHPVYNIREQDDKSFLHVVITKEEFPRVLLIRGKEKYGIKGKSFGPFTSASSLREALRILRRIFPWSLHEPEKIGKYSRPCFDYEVGLCPGTCIGAIDKKEYRKNIKRLTGIFEGGKKRVIRELEREMERASKALEYEKAAKLRKQIFALRHIHDIALIRDENDPATRDSLSATRYRIEGYDISNISGTAAVGSMVVFEDDQPAKREYRKFKIRTIAQSDDVGMLKEVLRRRFTRYQSRLNLKNVQGSTSVPAWPLPHLILIDGGKGQVNAAEEILNETGLAIPLIGMAKGPKRKKTEIIGTIPAGIKLSTLIQVRDEAHRFAITYHKRVRGREFLQ